MATWRFSTTSSGAEAVSSCYAVARFIDFSRGRNGGVDGSGGVRRSGNKAKQLILMRKWQVRPMRRSFSVRNASSEPQQKVKDPITEKEDASSIASSIKYHAEFNPLFSPEKFDLPKAFFATAQSIRDALIINWNTTYDYYEKLNPKQAYYLSMEFLQGRAMLNAIGNLGLTGGYAEALSKLGHNLENIAFQEPDAALGNGGLGRLASCFLDSLATFDYPAWGYGLRYKYGLFKQCITKNGQEEVAEDWLEMSNPSEIVRNDVTYPIKFYGKVVTDSDGKKHWIGGEDINAVAYDVPIPGYKTKTTINLRLWSTKAPSEDFDLSAFNSGEHIQAAKALYNAEKICYVLYPGDESIEGKILRLKQQYTLCSASLHDIIARFERRSGTKVKWEEFPEKVAVQMNDTHPSLCIPELMRILIDVKGLSWKEAWNITQRTMAYTNHTVLPEALEKWSLELMGKLLPRHVEIIEMIDEELIRTIVLEYGTADSDLLEKKLKQMRILENVELPAAFSDLLVSPKESPVAVLKKRKKKKKKKKKEEEEVVEPADGENEPVKESTEGKKKIPEPVPELPKMVRMANLCVVGGHAVNGVAAIHSEIVKDEVFNDFFKFADNEDLQAQWRAAKRSNKLKAVSFLKEKTGYLVSPDAMFDIQVKRIHEYKRQLLNILGIVYRYKMMKEMSASERKEKFVPRVCIFGGKAFATYVQAKRIVKFITDVGATVNHDPDIGDLLKVVFVPDYNVSVAELLIPASELSQHISTAGMEASGTSNMKFAMNGCILIGTLDGANVEIREEVGEDNFFLFGAEAHEIPGLRKERAEGKFVPDPHFEEVKEFVRSGVFGPYNYDELMGSLEGNEGFGRADFFLVGKDFPSYIECQEKVDEAYKDQQRWTRMSILNTAGSYKFSSDRTIHEYAREIWNIKPVELP
ncbi:alpha-1,4 glucan phosphorylase L isozyme, chloroplastic/amyloplastic-like isoform X2 [Durio zibethinus]|uniref:Alpha-1,4 glucan phosphorylase n=1 Tax=Durio zibethinus TaxID=66656 RepID=A0A6P6BBV8_DURZI|nr:alpha-1,4 glucan phosphorylase L isozyme, chloroplastic/amyloplastic-like isoform X2 [Durio zibethinus]